MSQVNVSIEEVEVMNIHEFCSSKGYGLDINVAAKSDTCTVYLQIVLYDSRARDAYNRIHACDILQKVTGVLKLKSYVKSDHTAGSSYMICSIAAIYLGFLYHAFVRYRTLKPFWNWYKGEATSHNRVKHD